jgi:hypothetical protein
MSWRFVTTVTTSAEGSFVYSESAGAATRFYALREKP